MKDTMRQQAKARARSVRKTAKIVQAVTVPLLASPMAGAAELNGTPGDLAQKAIIWVAEQGDSSTGTKIMALKGAARQGATFARVGLGTLANGGYGIAGGKIILQRSGQAVAVAGLAAYAASYIANERTKKIMEMDRAQKSLVLCSRCQGLLPAAAEVGAHSPADTVCPHYGHAENSE
ncbi:hypothetical protein [Arthrobacter sp. CP30]